MIPIEVSKNDSDEVIDFLIYKNHYLFNKKLNVFLGSHNCKFNYRRCLKSYTCQNMMIKPKENFEQKQKITTIETSDFSHLYWKNHCHKNPLYLLCFRIVADFEAVNEVDTSNICNKTTVIYKQNPVYNG